MLAIIILAIIKRIPIIFSTIFKHYVHGPPQPSWSLTAHLSVNIIQTFSDTSYQKLSIETIQGDYPFLACKIPSDLKLVEINIPNEYRIKAQVYIQKLVKPFDIVIDPIWKTPKDNDIKGDIIMSKDWDGDDDWTKEKIVIYLHGGAFAAGNHKMAHPLCFELSRKSGARILSINYRKAPQNPFPSALCDALATYLYLVDPPKNSGFNPYRPEQIVFGGDSSGGAMAISLALAIRDLSLPLPAGIVALCPWLDLTHSMPSFSDPAYDESDVLPELPGFKFATDTNSNAYREFRSRTGNIMRNIQQHPEIKIIGDESLKRIGNQSINFYVVNEGLGIPYVSPMLAESLGGLPPMLINVGNAERLRDEAIYLAYRASNPEKYRIPKYEVDFNNSQFKAPSKKVVLEIYDEMYHNFQISNLESSKVSVRRAGEFISTAVREALQANPTSNKFETYKITYQGEVQNLDESSIENVLNWDKAGVYPGV